MIPRAIVERIKTRLFKGKAIILIEEADGKITGYEFKYSPIAKLKTASEFKETYNAEVYRVDRKNFWKFAELRI